MGRSWLVVGMIALAADAHADRISCVKPVPTALPKSGATGVPLNAKVWDLGGKEGSVEYEQITIQSVPFDRNETYPAFTYALRDLAADHTYQLSGPGPQLSFTTGRAIDTTPPATPVITGTGVDLVYQPLQTMPVASLRLTGRYDDDTALIRLEIRDRFNSAATLVVLPGEFMFVCDPGMRLAPGHGVISVTAIDLAGNPSTPWRGTLVIPDPTSPDPRGHVGADTGSMALIMFGPVLLAGILLGILLIATLRHWRLRREPGDTVSLLVADHVARLVLRRATSFAVAGAAGIAGACVLGQPIVALALALIASVPVSTLIAARRVLRLVDTAEAAAEVREAMLVVTSPSGTARLASSHRVIDAARRKGVPGAAVQRDS